MPGLKKRDIDDGIANAKASGKEARLWDDNPRGLGLRIKPKGSATFFIQYQSPITFKKTRFSIAQYGKITLDQARTQARSLFEAIAKGRDPAREKKEAKQEADTAVTVSAFCDDYMHDAKAGLVLYRGNPKKASTLEIDNGRIERHIKPLIGDRLLKDITKKDIEKVKNSVRLGKTAVDEKTGFRGRAIVTGGPTAANRVLGLLGSIFTYAKKQEIITENPVHGIERFEDAKRERFLSPDEYKSLGTALDDLEAGGSNPKATRAYRLLAITGCRRDEVLGLEKTEVNIAQNCFDFIDTKGGKQRRVMNHYAQDLLSLPEFKKGSRFVFPATRGNGHLTDAKMFKRACKIANIEDASLHTLRHSFASVALELGYSEITIGGIIGHKQKSVTSRYTHHVDGHLIAAADAVAQEIDRRMKGQEASDNVVPIKTA